MRSSMEERYGRDDASSVLVIEGSGDGARSDCDGRESVGGGRVGVEPFSEKPGENPIQVDRLLVRGVREGSAVNRTGAGGGSLFVPRSKLG